MDSQILLICSAKRGWVRNSVLSCSGCNRSHAICLSLMTSEYIRQASGSSSTSSPIPQASSVSCLSIVVLNSNAQLNGVNVGANLVFAHTRSSQFVALNVINGQLQRVGEHKVRPYIYAIRSRPTQTQLFVQHRDAVNDERGTSSRLVLTCGDFLPMAERESRLSKATPRFGAACRCS